MVATPPGPADRLVLACVPSLGALWLRLARLTMRLRWVGAGGALPEDGGPVIYAFWHSQLAMMPWAQLRPPSVVPISRSRDGEWTARLFRHLAVEPVRGSSSRGGVSALKGLVRASRRGRDLAITPDGPRGPAERAKAGAVWLAQVSERPLLPLAFACRPALRLNSWDRLLVPLPFGTGVFLYGEPLWVPAGVKGDGREAFRLELQRRLRELSARAARELLLP